MIKRIDLHVHSNCSDGTLSPTELVALAKKRNVTAFALTDHDTTAGIEEAIFAGKKENIEVIPGIELSTCYEGKDIHLLGLGIDIHNVHFQDSLLRFQNERDFRNLAMIEKLQEVGIEITYEKMLTRFPDSVWTRAHFARFIMETGHVKDLWEAFPLYIGDDAPCFVPRERITPFSGIKLIQEGGGIAILAHPLLYGFPLPKLEGLISQLKEMGLDGLEVMYSLNRHGDEGTLKMLAKKYDLKVSGGSDFHGSNKPSISLGTGKGNLNIDYDVWKFLYA